MRNYEVENESAQDLEIEGFSDHNPDLFYNQQNISDRLVYECMGLELKKFFFQAEGVFQVKSWYSKPGILVWLFGY